MASGMELIEKCRGRWRGILIQLGIDGSFLTGKHGPCPICGGEDRFRFDDKNGEGTWFCGQGTPQAGYGLRLVQLFRRCTIPAAMGMIDEVVDTVPVSLSTAGEIRAANFDPRPSLNKLWLLSDRLTGSDTASKYLHSRGLVLTPQNIRYSTSCYESDTKKRYHALIARIQKANGKSICLHRIYLENDRKAKIPSPKKLMPATEILQGSSVRLFSSQDKLFHNGILGVAEGIETALACAHKFRIATWACLSSTLMPSWTPPIQIREVVVFGDNDANYAGQEAAYKLAHILHSKQLIVKVMIPDKVGDWADAWLKYVRERKV